MKLLMICAATFLVSSVASVPINRPPPSPKEENGYEGFKSQGVFDQIQVGEGKPRPLTLSPQTNYIRPPVSQYVPQPPPHVYRPPPPYDNYNSSWSSQDKPNPSKPNKSPMNGIPNKVEGPQPTPLLFPLAPPPIPLPAEECLTRDGEVGECLTAFACGENDGSMSGLCHQGMDHSAYPRVCCTYQSHCGSSTTKLVSYFTSPSYPQLISNHTDCSLEVVLKPGVCQVRLDFLDFQLGEMTNGLCSPDNQMVIESSVKHAFIPSRTLCGNLAFNKSADPLDNLRTDQAHMYIHIEDLPVDTQAKKMPNAPIPDVRLSIKVTDQPSQWNIRVTQIQCDGAPLQAPGGCSQYYNDLSGVIRSLNYFDNKYMANMDMTACIRYEPKACAIAYNIDDMSIGEMRGKNKVGYGLTCGDYISFQGEKTCMCGKTVSRELVFPIRGAQGVHLHSDAVNSGSDAGFQLSYRYIQDCEGLGFFKYPQLRSM